MHVSESRSVSTSHLRRRIAIVATMLVLVCATKASAPVALTQVITPGPGECLAIQVPQHPLGIYCQSTPEGDATATPTPTASTEPEGATTAVSPLPTATSQPSAPIVTGTQSASANDADDDGLTDEEELAVYRTDPQVADTDGDGLKDGEEIILGTNPLLVDTDGDGLADTTEFLGVGTSPLHPDTDGDGLSDGVEVANGSDPNDPASPMEPEVLG